MSNDCHPSTRAGSNSLSSFSLVLAAAAVCLSMAGPAASQTQVPDAPVIQVTPRLESLSVAWDAVPGAIDYQVVWHEESAGNTWADGITATSYTIEELDPGLYTVVAYARNGVGYSDVSNTVYASPLAHFTIADVSETEGSTLVFTVTLSDEVSTRATVQYSTSDGTATADANSADGPDYTQATDATLTFDTGETEKTILIATGDDTAMEGDETFTVTLSNPSSNAVLGRMHTATGTIKDDDRLGPGTVELGGARVGSPTAQTRDAEVDICWDVGAAMPAGSDIVIEARERYYWSAARPFNAWEEIARGDSFTQCSGSDTGVQYSYGTLHRGLAFEMEFRIRQGGSVLATSPVLKAQAPNSDANALRAFLTVAVDPDTGAGIDAPDGPFVMELDFTDPYLHALLPELVQGLETADFDVTNGTVTGVEIWDAGTYEVSVTPATLGQPVTIGLPANKVEGVGEGVSASGGNNYTRDNFASNTVVQETTGSGDSGRSVGQPLTVEFEDVPAAHDGRKSFSVRIRFSEPVSTSYRTLQNKAVTAVGGKVRKAKRVRGRNDLWAITVSPSSDAPLTLRVVSRGACGGSRAVCTADGRVLSNSPSVTVQGPGGSANLRGPGAGEAAPPANRAPRAVGSIPPQVLGVEDADRMLDVAPHFADDDETGMTFSAESSAPAVAAVSVAGSLLTVTAVGPGAATVTVTARDAAGLTAAQAFEVHVADRWGRAATGDTLAALGRGYLSSVRSTLGRRVESRAPEAHVTVAGQRIPLGRSAAQKVSLSLLQRLFPPAAAPGGPGPGRQAPFGQPPARGRPSGHPASMTPERLPVAPRSGFGRLGLFGGGASQALRSTNVMLPLGGGADTDDTDAASPARRWTVWGQGDVQTFRGASSASGSTYDGDLQTAYVGVDARLNERWMTGVALARSFGSGTWSGASSSGLLTTALTAVHPYVQWSRGGTTVWALGGVGRGTAENVKASAAGGGETGGLGLGLGLVEARRDVAVIGGGVRLGLRGELSWARLTTDSGGETLDALQAGVRRTRAGLEASREWSGSGRLRLEPFGRLSVRQDGGAGQTGVGLELESGARLATGLVRVEAQARMLALHSVSHYAERGGSVTVSVGEGAQRPGLTLSLAPRWGAAQGADMLWQEHLSRPFGSPAGADRSVDARVSYGWRLRRRLLLAPFAGYGSSWGRRRVQLGARFGALDAEGGAGTPLHVELSGERYPRREGAADHRVSLLGVVSFGGRRVGAVDPMPAP